MNISQYESEDKYVGPILTETQIIFCCQEKKWKFSRDTFHKYISVMAIQLAVFFMSLQTCASDSAKIFAMCASIIQLSQL